MSESQNDVGTIQVLLERFNKFRLPRLLAISRRVDAGEKLSDVDIQFMKMVLEESRQVEPIAAHHPEYQSLVKQAISLSDEITRNALENEQGP